MKKKFVFVLSLVLILALSSVVFANSEIIIRIDSEKVEFNEDLGFPFLDENSRTQVPFKATMEKYGAEVEWDNENQTAIAKKGDITVKVPIGEKFIFKNDEKIATDAAALVKSGRTYLPIRPVIEAFGSEVQWDSNLNTVVITTEPIDAKEVLLNAYAKSYEWKNFDANMNMDMTMPAPNEKGEIQNMQIQMDMKMTAFQDPLKAKASADMVMDFAGTNLSQHVMDLYYNLDGNKFVMYMGMPNANGEIEWVKQTQENELFATLNKDKKESLELNKESIKDVKFFGKYTENGKTLLRVENTTSFDVYQEMLGGYMDMLSSSGKQEDILAANMLANIGDMTFVIYIDEETGEIVKYDMDLTPFMKSMFEGMGELLPPEGLEVLKNLKVKMEMEILNVNKAKDFEIPEEVLKAPEAPAPKALEG